MNRMKTGGRRISGITKAFAVIVGISMILMMSRDAFAAGASDVGTVLGHQCYASIGAGKVYGTAETTCDASTSTCTVVVTLVYYYYSSDKVLKSGSSTQSAAGTASAYANAYGNPISHTGYADSSHRVTYSTATPWTTSLHAFF